MRELGLPNEGFIRRGRGTTPHGLASSAPCCGIHSGQLPGNEEAEPSALARYRQRLVSDVRQFELPPAPGCVTWPTRGALRPGRDPVPLRSG